MTFQEFSRTSSNRFKGLSVTCGKSNFMLSNIFSYFSKFLKLSDILNPIFWWCHVKATGRFSRILKGHWTPNLYIIISNQTFKCSLYKRTRQMLSQKYLACCHWPLKTVWLQKNWSEPVGLPPLYLIPQHLAWEQNFELKGFPAEKHYYHIEQLLLYR